MLYLGSDSLFFFLVFLHMTPQLSQTIHLKGVYSNPQVPFLTFRQKNKSRKGKQLSKLQRRQQLQSIWLAAGRDTGAVPKQALPHHSHTQQWVLCLGNTLPISYSLMLPWDSATAGQNLLSSDRWVCGWTVAFWTDFLSSQFMSLKYLGSIEDVFNYD